MTYQELESHFGGMKQIMAAFNVTSRQTIYNWRNKGVPEGKQFEAEVMTQGHLKAEARKPS